MKNFKKFLLLLIPLYFIFMLITMNRFSSNEIYNEYNGRYLSEKNEIKSNLIDQYDAVNPNDYSKLFAPEFQKYILAKKVILDSTIIGAYQTSDAFFVNLQIGNPNGRIFARLQCDEHMFEEINKFRFSDALVVADISTLDIQSTPIDIFIEDDNFTTYLGEDILITGNCIEAIELASF